MHFFYEIKSVDDKWYTDFEKIYSVSFPVYEQRNFDQQVEAFADEHYHLYCIISNEQISSFVAFWDFGRYVYVEHMAVNGKLRGQHIGTDTLRLFMEEIGKSVVLEIDPVEDGTSAKRLRFYEKLGFVMNPFVHFHPAYDISYKPHRLSVLSKPYILSEQQYNMFKNDLESIVMRG
ncbi:GNAT family N-acetyltransferase [Dysgonomonas sp. OttesenSCG-928-M03]|nr:GNAT family N-acetyltransferase [Dysgonomonas sp. OttesenSCG-928-M03]